MTRERTAGILLATLGVLTVGTGLYFLLGRPAMLPEDVRFAGVAAPPAGSDMERWLRIVFRTMGAFVTAFGLVLGGLGTTIVTGRDSWLKLSLAAGVTLAFTQFIASNVMLRSDFLWPLALLYVLALITSACLVFSLGRRTLDDPTSAASTPIRPGGRTS